MVGGDLDAVMLLKHKTAIEFMVDAVPANGLTSAVIGNLRNNGVRLQFFAGSLNAWRVGRAIRA